MSARLVARYVPRGGREVQYRVIGTSYQGRVFGSSAAWMGILLYMAGPGLPGWPPRAFPATGSCLSLPEFTARTCRYS